MVSSRQPRPTSETSHPRLSWVGLGMASSGHLRPPEVGKARPEMDTASPPCDAGVPLKGYSFAAPSISFTPAELQAGVDNLKYSLVAKFSEGRPPKEEIRKALLAVWGLTGQCSIGPWNARHILVVLDSELDARKVLSHPLWKLGHAFFWVFTWAKDFNSRREPTTTTAWVRMNNLPHQMYNQGSIEAIVSSFGRFLALYNKTITLCNPSYAPLEVDTSHDLLDELLISTDTEAGFWQKVIYENRILYCMKCRLHGHDLQKYCKAKLRREEEQKNLRGA
ncbi:hypothetical protein QQ045_002366 [Rhodiola kirilowii]